ncbi:MAG: MYXO-CTERM sorting domain-containing protein [Polyangiales bacterium]
MATPMTITCAPPGSGARALDRDEDGVRDTDERDMGRDPADRPLIDVPTIGEASSPRPDGGMPSLDGGVVEPPLDGGTRRDAGRRSDGGPIDGGGDDGCNCRSAGSGAAGVWPVLLVWLGRRRR